MSKKVKSKKSIRLPGMKKDRHALVKFKSMAEILMTENCWFDGHGNLQVHTRSGVEHLAPTYFPYLGGMSRQPINHSFPYWCIEQEWEDIFTPNMALRMIASGKLSAKDQVELAKKAVMIP